MKKLSTIVVFLISLMSFSQTDNITNILNSALQNELRLQSEVMAEIDSTGTIIGYTKLADTIIVVKPFEIENNVLSVTIQKKLYYADGYIIEKQDVPLDKIASVSKDIGVLLDTLNEDVVITSTVYYDDGNTETSKSSAYFLRTYCVSEKQNDYLGDELVKAFKEAGYTITVSYWFD